MPAMPRINNKMRKIAEDILGRPDNARKTDKGIHKKISNKENGLDQDDRGWERQQWIPTISGTIKQGPWQ